VPLSEQGHLVVTRRRSRARKVVPAACAYFKQAKVEKGNQAAVDTAQHVIHGKLVTRGCATDCTAEGSGTDSKVPAGGLHVGFEAHQRSVHTQLDPDQDQVCDVGAGLCCPRRSGFSFTGPSGRTLKVTPPPTPLDQNEDVE
jgi:hypothetical protein